MLNYGVINDRSPHIMADLCEIICYFENIEVARGDVENFVNTKGGEGLLRDLIGEGGAEQNDKVQRFSEDAFRHLQYRQAAFGEWYPFVVNHDVLEIRDHQSDKNKIYAALLGDSRLKMFSRAKRILFASEFEAICREAAPGLFQGWTIYHFGVGGADRAMFGNKLKVALRRLAEKIKDDVIEKRVNKISDHDVGDGGIDLVAVREWKDPAESLPVYFAQCAAQQTGWPEKRFESHPITHEKYFSFFHKPGSAMFIPVCYRGTDGKWIGDDAHQSILLDRLRILELLDAQLDNGTKTVAELMSVFSEPFEVGCIDRYRTDEEAANGMAA